MSAAPDCSCLARGPKPPDRIIEREIGTDPTEGRYASVGLIRCSRCRRLWLRYFWEDESIAASGRWCEAVISEASAAAMKPAAAYRFIRSAPWRIIGGSFYGHDGVRIDRPAEAAETAATTFMVVYTKHRLVLRFAAPGEPASFFNRKTLRWHPWPRPIPPCARPVSIADAWRDMRYEMLGLDFGTIERPWREWPIHPRRR
jgi:hypothetical protein